MPGIVIGVEDRKKSCFHGTSVLRWRDREGEHKIANKYGFIRSLIILFKNRSENENQKLQKLGLVAHGYNPNVTGAET